MCKLTNPISGKNWDENCDDDDDLVWSNGEDQWIVVDKAPNSIHCSFLYAL